MTIVVVLTILALQSTVHGFTTSKTLTLTTTSSSMKHSTIRPVTVSLQESVEATSYATCGKCGSSYAIDDAALGGGNGRYVGKKTKPNDRLCILFCFGPPSRLLLFVFVTFFFCVFLFFPFPFSIEIFILDDDGVVMSVILYFKLKFMNNNKKSPP